MIPTPAPGPQLRLGPLGQPLGTLHLSPGSRCVPHTHTHRCVPAARTHTPHRVPAQCRLPHLGLPPCESGRRPRNPLPRWGHPRDSPGSSAGHVGLFGSMGVGSPCPWAPGLTPKGQLPSACREGGRGGGVTRRQQQQRKPAQRLQTGSDRTRVLRRQRRGQGRQARAAQRDTDQPRGCPPPAPSLPPPAHAPAAADGSRALEGGRWRPLPACPSRFNSRRTQGSRDSWHMETSSLGSGAAPRLRGGHSPTKAALAHSHPHSAVSPEHLPRARPCTGSRSLELYGVLQAAGAAPVPGHSWRERAKDGPARVGGRAEAMVLGTHRDAVAGDSWGQEGRMEGKGRSLLSSGSRLPGSPPYKVQMPSSSAASSREPFRVLCAGLVRAHLGAFGKRRVGHLFGGRP